MISKLHPSHPHNLSSDWTRGAFVWLRENVLYCVTIAQPPHMPRYQRIFHDTACCCGNALIRLDKLLPGVVIPIPNDTKRYHTIPNDTIRYGAIQDSTELSYVIRILAPWWSVVALLVVVGVRRRGSGGRAWHPVSNFKASPIFCKLETFAICHPTPLELPCTFLSCFWGTQGVKGEHVGGIGC